MKPMNWIAAGVFSLLGALPAAAQDFPNRVITMVVPFAAGGPGDTIARLVGAAMSQQLNQQIIIENTLGAGGTIGTHRVAKAAPDGYTHPADACRAGNQRQPLQEAAVRSSERLRRRSALSPTCR